MNGYGNVREFGSDPGTVDMTILTGNSSVVMFEDMGRNVPMML